MEAFVHLFEVVLPVFLIAGVAALSQRWLKLDPRALSRATFYVFIPALIFDALADADLGRSQVGPMTVALLIVTLLLLGLGWAVARALRLTAQRRGAFLSAVVMANVGNYGLPVVQMAFGTAGLVPAAIYLMLFNMLLIPLGIYLAAQGKTSVTGALRHVITVPALYAAALGVAFSLGRWSLPVPVMVAVRMLAQATNPVFLLILGVQLQGAVTSSWDKRMLPALASLVALRLLVSPGLAWGVGGWVGLHGLTFDVFVLDNAFPTAVLVGIFATEYDADPEFATLCIFVTTIVSLLTVPLVLGRIVG